MPARTQTRNAPDYDWDNDGGSSRQGVGIYILKPDVNAQVKKPSWNGTETIFRPFPCVSFSEPDTAFEPYRRIEGDRAKFGDWIRRYACAWMVGNPSITYLIRKTHKLYDAWSSPLGILYRAIEGACKKGHPNTAEWQPLRESSNNRGRALKGPGELYLLQGALLKHDKTEYGGKNGPPPGWGKNPTCVLTLSTDAGKKLVDLLNQEKKDYKGPVDNFEERYEYGDPVSPLFGRFFHFWEHGSNARGSSYNSQPTQMASAFDDVKDGDISSGGRGPAFVPKGFDLEIAKTVGPRPASFAAAGEDQIRQHWKHWDDILHFPTEAEQAQMLFSCYPVSACIYAFEENHKEWIPPEAYRQLANAKTVQVAGAVKGGIQDAPPADMDGWGSAPVAETQAPKSSTPAPAVASNEWDNDGAAIPADSTVPSGAIADDPVASAAPPVEPTPVTPPASGSAARTADAIAKLAKTRSQMQQ